MKKIIDENSKVSDFITNERLLNLSNLLNTLPTYIIKNIVAFPIPIIDINDRPVWKSTPLEIFLLNRQSRQIMIRYHDIQKRTLE